MFDDCEVPKELWKGLLFCALPSLPGAFHVVPEAPKPAESVLGDPSPSDLVPEPVVEVAPLAVAGAAAVVAVDAVVDKKDEDEDHIA